MNKIAGKITKISVLTILIMAMIPVTVMAAKRCQYTSCNNKPIDGGVYCSSHTCIAPGCNNLRYGGGTDYCYSHKCNHKGCSARRVDGCNFCSTHKTVGMAEEAAAWKKVQSKNNNKSKYSTSKKNTGKSSAKTSGSKKKTYDSYNVYDYKSAQDFADDKYEEFYDYEDDFDDEDEAYDAAEDYWREHH